MVYLHQNEREDKAMKKEQVIFEGLKAYYMDNGKRTEIVLCRGNQILSKWHKAGKVIHRHKSADGHVEWFWID